jgi:hypothetical protein
MLRLSVALVLLGTTQLEAGFLVFLREQVSFPSAQEELSSNTPGESSVTQVIMLAGKAEACTRGVPSPASSHSRPPVAVGLPSHTSFMQGSGELVAVKADQPQSFRPFHDLARRI